MNLFKPQSALKYVPIRLIMHAWSFGLVHIYAGIFENVAYILLSNCGSSQTSVGVNIANHTFYKLTHYIQFSHYVAEQKHPNWKVD